MAGYKAKQLDISDVSNGIGAAVQDSQTLRNMYNYSQYSAYFLQSAAQLTVGQVNVDVIYGGGTPAYYFLFRNGLKLIDTVDFTVTVADGFNNPRFVLTNPINNSGTETVEAILFT